MSLQNSCSRFESLSIRQAGLVYRLCRRFPIFRNQFESDIPLHKINQHRLAKGICASLQNLLHWFDSSIGVHPPHSTERETNPHPLGRGGCQLKSVLYQPVPLRLNPADVTCFLNSVDLHFGHSVSGASLNFCIIS